MRGPPRNVRGANDMPATPHIVLKEASLGSRYSGEYGRDLHTMLEPIVPTRNRPRDWRER